MKPRRPRIPPPVFILLTGLVFSGSSARAHNPDTSYLRCAVGRQSLDLRFTLDLATIFRITHPDADNNGKVSRAELDAAAPEIFSYLENFVHLEINGRPAGFGERRAMIWPADAGAAVEEKDYHQCLVHFPFRARTPALIEDLYVLYDVFDELGDRHRIISDLEQEGRHLEVIFTMFEPDYLYDTFYRSENAPAGGVASWFPAGVREVWHDPAMIACLFLGSLGAFGSGRGRRVLLLLALVLAVWLAFEGFKHAARPWSAPGPALARLAGAALSTLILLPPALAVLRLIRKKDFRGPKSGV